MSFIYLLYTYLYCTYTVLIGVKFKCKGGEAVFITTLPVVLMESPLAKEPSSLRRLAHDLIVKHIQVLIGCMYTVTNMIIIDTKVCG